MITMFYKVLSQLGQVGDASDLGLPETDASSIGPIVQILALIGGALSVIFIIYGGFVYVASGGSPEQTKRAKEIILYAIIGLIISLMAGGIVTFILSNL